MEREQRQPTIIDLDDTGSRRMRVATAMVAALVAVLVIVPFVVDDLTAPADAPGVTLQVGGSAPPSSCRPTFDVPHLLDPVARIVLPGWTRLCGWLSQPDIVDPLDPSG